MFNFDGAPLVHQEPQPHLLAFTFPAAAQPPPATSTALTVAPQAPPVPMPANTRRGTTAQLTFGGQTIDLGEVKSIAITNTDDFGVTIGLA